MPGVKRSYSAGPAAAGAARPSKRSKRVYKKVMKALMPELKYFDTFTNTAAGQNNSGAIMHLTNIAAGDEYNNRSGRKIHLKYVQYDIVLIPETQPSTGSCAADFARLDIVVDKQANNSAPSFGDIYDTGTVTAGFMAFRNLAQNSARFKIIKSICMGPIAQNFVSSGGTGVSASGTPTHLRGMVKVPGAVSVVTYAGSAAGVPETNAVYAIFTNVLGSASTACKYSLATRVAYNDC